MSFDGDHLLHIPASPVLRDVLLERTESAGDIPVRAATAAQLAVALEAIEQIGLRVLDRGDLYRVSAVTGDGPEIVTGADGETYVVDAAFRLEPVVKRIQDVECYVCYEALGVEVYQGDVVCRQCSLHERRYNGDLITVYEPCREGRHDDCVRVEADEASRPLDLAPTCECTCHGEGDGAGA